MKEQPPTNTIHYTELPPAWPGSSNATEWDCYRREVGRLLAEGHEGKFVLIKGETIVGIWDTWDEAKTVALQKYLREPVLIQQILTRDRVVISNRFYFSFPGNLDQATSLARSAAAG